MCGARLAHRGRKEPTALTVGTPKSESSRQKSPAHVLADMLKELADGATQGYIFEAGDGGMQDVRTFFKEAEAHLRWTGG